MKIQLESSRLLYRPFEVSDAQDLFLMDANPIVHKYLWQKPTLHIDESLQIIFYLLKQYNENGIDRYATFLKETGEFIGWTGIKYINDHVENGASNHILRKAGFQEIETYYNDDNVAWKWWQFENNLIK
jgi:ribosomal-protein-alanine N-acetyltransferase